MSFKDFQKLFSLRLTASYLLAFAMKDLFPDAKLVSGGGDSLGFYYDFFFPYPVNDELLTQLQEKMHFLRKSNLSVQFMEMVPPNAIEYLEHLNNHYHPKDLLTEDQLTKLIKLGDLVDIAPNVAIEEISSLEYFQLLDVELLEDRVIRVRGTAFFNKMDLKKSLKALKIYKKSRSNWIKKYFYVCDDARAPVWLPNGIALKKFLSEQLEEHLYKEGFVFLDNTINLETPTETPLLDKLFPIRKEEKKLQVAEWIIPEDGNEETYFSGNSFFKKQLSERIFCEQKSLAEVVKTSIDSISNLLNECGLQCELTLSGSGDFHQVIEGLLQESNRSYVNVDGEKTKLQFYFDDSLGRFFAGPYIEVNCSLCEKTGLSYSSRVTVERSSFGSIEDLAGIIIEKGQGNLPFFLSPEQVRIIPLEGDTKKTEGFYIHCLSCGLRAKIDDRPIDSRVKSQQGAKDEVPYLVFMKEGSENLFVRKQSMPRAKEMSLATFMDEVQWKKTERHFED